MPANSKPIEAVAVDERVGIHLPSLCIALAIMLVGSIYPLIFTRANGTVNHGFAIAIFWTMSAGFVRGVGFVPVARIWRLLFSGWSCLAGITLAAWLHQGI
jgi:predicted membrane protein